MSYLDTDRRLYWRNQKRDEYARRRGFDSWDAYIESKRRMEQLAHQFEPPPRTPPWKIVGWTRKRYIKWLDELVKMFE